MIVSKTFEDLFSELQTDMVAVCMEYVEDRADDIYIYGYMNRKCIHGMCFTGYLV